MSRLEVNVDLVRKYNIPGPRYTSYPPATHFSTGVAWDQVLREIEKANESKRPLSLYYHIPFCESLCWYCGCTSVTTLSRRRSEEYIDHVIKEMDLLTHLVDRRRLVVQLHLGGGTPTFCTPDQLRRLGEAIYERFKVADDVEAGVEVDPRGLTFEHLSVLRKIGFNRISVGVQDFDTSVQKAVHRIQPFELTAQAVAWARELGFKSVNLDLIYGLPFQSVESFTRTLEHALSLSPERLVVFSYAHVPWLKPAQKILERSGLPAPELKLELLKLSIEKLTSSGYVYIGMDHFARPDDELVLAQKKGTLQRNFQGYSTRAGADIIAFGMSSISQVPGAYWQNVKDLASYQSTIGQGKIPYFRGWVLSEDDRLRRDIIMEIMCNLRVEFNRIEERWGIRFQNYFARELDQLRSLEADGLVQLQPDRLVVTEQGRLLVRVVAMAFDSYTSRQRERRHAMTI